MTGGGNTDDGGSNEDGGGIENEGGIEGPTLYLEDEELDPTEAFCSEVLADEPAGEYRVVQLTSTNSFDSLRDAFDVQLERIRDPSEAAVILLSPTSADDATVSEVGEDTQLFGFWVDPQDLTGISVAFSRLIDRWEDTPATTRICLRDLESLLPYHETDLLYRFLNTVLATLQGAGADVHVHLRPGAVDDRTLELFAPLFARVVGDDRPAEAPTTAESPATPETSSPADETPGSASAPGTARSTTMTDEEIDDFLAEEGQGVLAFAGDPPYAVPMSFGYDAEARELVLQMSTFEGSEKQARLAESDAVTLVVSRYERPDRWRSVVVDGSLRRLTEEAAYDRGVPETFAAGELASVDVFSRDPDDVSFDWYVLDPDGTSGRQSTGSR